MSRPPRRPQGDHARHVPVLMAEVLTALDTSRGGLVIDGTFGAGGYTRAILDAHPELQVVAIDRDPTAIAAGAEMVRAAEGRLRLVPGRFGDLDTLLAGIGEERADAVVLDIGVSSMQLDQAERGFSFQADGPLDMRMAQEGPSAADFVNEADEAEIADVIYRYGDEPKSRRIARAIVAARPVTRTGELAAIVRRAVGWKPHDKKDPATRTFQAVRIHVNRELGELADGLAAAERVLKPGGRLAVVTFHSLEDRMVKRFLRDRSGAAPSASRHLPAATAATEPSFEKVGRAVRAGEAELARNPRARSATLRTATRTAAPAWKTEVSV